MLDPQLEFSGKAESVNQDEELTPSDIHLHRKQQVFNQHRGDPIIPHEIIHHHGENIPDLSTENETDPNVILKAFSDEERQIILKIPGSKNVKDLRLFARLAPYFSGRYHIEEILFFANVRRCDLHVILDLFEPIIALHEHEDTAITSFYDTSLRVSR